MSLPATILVTNRTNIRYLSGFSGTSGYLVMHGAKGFLLTDARYHLVAKKVLPRGFSLIDVTKGFEKPCAALLKKLRVRSLGFEGEAVSLAFWRKLKKICKGISLVDVERAVSEKRIVKRKDELVYLQKAQAITDRILKELKKTLKKGQSEEEIAWQVEVLARQFGAQGVSFPAIIAFNENSAAPHHQPTSRKLRVGDLILIDMGVIYKGYCSDMTRVLFTKAPTPEQEEIYNVVLQAQKNAIKKIKAGITGVAGDVLARSVIRTAGYAKEFGHSLGHGVGLDIHELPNLSERYKEKIPAGTVVTIEPGIYLPGKFGVRLEDMVLVTKTGTVNLTKSPKAIQECIIKLS